MKTLIFLCVALFATACDVAPSSDHVQSLQQERLSKQATQQVGMPAITNFQEKRILKNILELRDTEIKTTTYIVDMNGKLHKLCDSVGYGIPYATQYTSPQRPARSEETHEQGNVVVPQADPNGLFSPAAADGTWVLCFNPKDNKLSPLYVEPHIITSPFPIP